MEQRDDGLGGEEGYGGDVHLRERRRETLRVILRKFEGATIYDEAGWGGAAKQEKI